LQLDFDYALLKIHEIQLNSAPFTGVSGDAAASGVTAVEAVLDKGGSENVRFKLAVSSSSSIPNFPPISRERASDSS